MSFQQSFCRSVFVVFSSCILVVIAGCNDSTSSSEEPEVISIVYPLQLGFHWEYHVTGFQIGGETEENGGEIDYYFNIDADSLVLSPDSIQTIRLISTCQDTSYPGYHFDYIVNRSDGLFELGYSNYGNFRGGYVISHHAGPFGFIQSFSSERATVANREIFWYSNIPNYDSNMLLPYPQTVGTTWTYQPDLESTSTIENEIAGYQNVTTPEDTYTCVEKRYILSFGGDPCETVFTVYYSTPGMVKYYADGGMKQLTDELGNIIDTVHCWEQWELVEFTPGIE